MDKLTGMGLRNGRPTIGYLELDLNAYGTLLWSGALDVAQTRDVNLITFVGGEWGNPPDFRSQANVLYELVGPINVDGLVLSTAGLIPSSDFTQLNALLARCHPLPATSIARIVEGVPSTVVKGEMGMYDLVSHLIEAHGCRRIAIIRGNEGQPEDDVRYQGYVKALAAHYLPLDPNLVTPHYLWSADWRKGSLPAMEVLLDERRLRPKVDIDAIIGSNDASAVSVIEILRERGIRVPFDVAVVGFDDQLICQSVTPSLSTVRQPIAEQARWATETLLTMMVGKPVPEQINMPTQMVIRQSCGCLDPVVVQVATGPAQPSGITIDALPAAQREAIIAEMTQAVGTPEVGPTSEWARYLLDGFVTAIKTRSAELFLQELDEMLRQVGTLGGNAEAWQSGLSVLRRGLLPYLEGEVLSRADDLWQQMRVMMGQAAKRMQAYQTLQAEQQVQAMRQLSQALITTFDIADLMNVLAEGLPRLGIPSCYLSLYEDPKQPVEGSRLVLAYTEQGRIALEPSGRRFPTTQLVPEGLWPPGRRYTYVVEALYFREDQLGFVLFEVGPREGGIYDALRGQISSALQGALLVQRGQERSAELARQQYILNTFIENVPDPIYFKDLDSRITRANKAHATALGVSDPAEEIGKRDFDFFPEELASIFYEQEQAVIRTGQPILNLEESDGMGRWALTTKMPLCDENGNIIGTFGISRDIAERKRAEAALERRAAQLALLNEVGRKIATILDLESVLNTAAHLVQESFGYHHVGLFTLDRERGELVMRAKAGQFAHLLPSGHRIKLGQGLVGWVGDYGARLLADDVSVESRYTNFYPDLIPTRSELGVPIRVGEETVGVLDVQSPHLNAFDQNDVMVMEILADQIAVAIENARLYEAVQRELVERRRAEEQLRRSSAELAQSNEELKQFAYIVSHDLRVPLVNLKGFAAELASSLQVIRPAFETLSAHLDEKQRSVVATAFRTDLPEALGFIDASATRMDHFINALLTLSRLGRRELDLERINMAALVQTTLETLAHQIELGQIQVTVGPLPEVVADRTSLEQILGNILNNAIIYLDPGRPGEIEITGERNGDETIFRVRDNGRGIAVEDMNKVFAPFRRAGKQDVPGEGMGLAYVQTLVRRHQGQIWCESEPGIGTTFTFTITHQFTQGDPHD